MSSARILYLDDEAPLVFLMKRMLEHLGHGVQAFTNSDEALAAFTAAPTQFDLVMTDMSMPGMSGIEGAQRVLALRPDTLIVIATGHIQDRDVERARIAGVHEVIQKPNSLEAMARTVERLLSREAADK
ncbi:MAG: response regulator [Gammaproteobacteria bacterium]